MFERDREREKVIQKHSKIDIFYVKFYEIFLLNHCANVICVELNFSFFLQFDDEVINLELIIAGLLPLPLPIMLLLSIKQTMDD